MQVKQLKSQSEQALGELAAAQQQHPRGSYWLRTMCVCEGGAHIRMYIQSLHTYVS